MSLYNLTAIGDNTTGLLSLAQGVNEILIFGWLGTILLIGLSVVMLLNFYFSTGDVKRSLTATAYISFVFSLLLRAIDLVPELAVFITLVLAAGALAITWRD